jgi:hypothetical protein
MLLQSVNSIEEQFNRMSIRFALDTDSGIPGTLLMCGPGAFILFIWDCLALFVATVVLAPLWGSFAWRAESLRWLQHLSWLSFFFPFKEAYEWERDLAMLIESPPPLLGLQMCIC